jgi:hypothetical protein
MWTHLEGMRAFGMCEGGCHLIQCIICTCRTASFSHSRVSAVTPRHFTSGARRRNTRQASTMQSAPDSSNDTVRFEEEGVLGKLRLVLGVGIVVVVVEAAVVVVLLVVEGTASSTLASPGFTASKLRRSTSAVPVFTNSFDATTA